MIINLIGDCDKRPVLYTLMKVCQTIGDVLVITDETRLLRLSDTRETEGHYQNVMIAVTYEDVDDFMEEFAYDYTDFDFVLVGNLVVTEAELSIYVAGMVQSEQETEMLEYVEEYETIKLYEGKMTFANTPWNLEEFEAYRTMCPISAGVAHEVARILSKHVGRSAENIESIAMQPTSMHKPKSTLKLPIPVVKKKGGKK